MTQPLHFVTMEGAIQPIIILVEPQLPENIGMVARAMLNFGLTELRLVNPRPLWPSDRAIDSSAGANRLLEAAKVYRSFMESTADCRKLYAASVRPRDMVKRVVTPQQAVAEIREFYAQPAAVRAEAKCAVVFGPERTGLVNDDIALMEAVVTIPVNPEFSSLNLAQAVVVVAYEWFKSVDETAASVLRTGQSLPAEQRQLQGFLLRLEQELDLCGFLRTDHMRAAMVRNLHALFARAQLTDQELRSLHGVITELVTRRVGRE